MSDISLDPQLLKQIEHLASERAISTAELVESALRNYLRQLEKDQIQSETEAFRNMHTELLSRYADQYVAIYEGKLVDHDPDFQSIHERIRQRFGRQPILIRRVTSEIEHTLTFHSPHLESRRR